MSKRYGFVLSALILVALAGCTPADGPVAAADTGAPEPEPEPSSSQDVDLAGLTLTVADLPTGGWTLDPATSDAESAETSTDKTAGETCGLDFTSLFPPDTAENDHGSTFSRTDLNQRFITAVVFVNDAEQLTSELSTELDSCTGPHTSTSNGKDTRVEIDELVGGDQAIEGDTKSCRQYEMAIGYTSMSGSFCFIADGDLITTTMTTGPSMSTVQPDEFVQLTNAATQKAFAAR
ncbi:hypothetical protein K2F54_01535 [Cryobacterium sp. 1639]|uniref:hypothetical protein n=1 Tax=Cryobacterium inferilacus TaxID=2866629 RepID=UPI001C73028D|nr:hypothetical protein [Cryobacterium sp. 1639]MBX0298650.1 hypothetical protein [Cryobacterium sp. 1639]